MRPSNPAAMFVSKKSFGPRMQSSLKISSMHRWSSTMTKRRTQQRGKLIGGWPYGVEVIMVRHFDLMPRCGFGHLGRYQHQLVLMDVLETKPFMSVQGCCAEIVVAKSVI